MDVGPHFVAPIVAALVILALLSMLQAQALQSGLKRISSQARMPLDGFKRDASANGRADLDYAGTRDFAQRVERATLAADSFGKRMFDLLAASALIIVLAPLIALVAVLIKLDSRGPVLYRQQRIGFGGRPFEILKFRSMVAEAEKNGPVWAAKNDCRVTRVGRIIRKLRIDEIPQAANVLRGEMSFVGPRPERPEFVKILEREIPNYHLRHAVRPGITGWAQVKYVYGASVDDARVKLQYDLYYIEHFSLLRDLLIMAMTVRVALFGIGSR